MELPALLAFGFVFAFLMVVCWVIWKQSKEQISDLDSVLLEACLRSGKSMAECHESLHRVKSVLDTTAANRAIGC